MQNQVAVMASFVTDEGVMVPAITAKEMREVDRIAIDDESPSLLQMMENAGRNLASTAVEQLGPGWRNTPITVFAGPGGNGGGGICAARHLANHGGDVTLILADHHEMSPAADQQLTIYQKTPGRTQSLGSFERGLILDALIGYGLEGAPRGQAREMIQAMREAAGPVISLDVPSGLDSTTGETPGESVEAITTLALALPKTGLSATAAGDVWLGDLGIPNAVYERAGIHLPQSIFDGRYRIPLHRQVP